MNAIEFYTKLTNKKRLIIPDEVSEKLDLKINSDVKVILLQEENEDETELIANSPEIVNSIKRIRKSKPKRLLTHKEVFGNEI